jgi:PAS domain S-box-containing protein
MSDELTYDHAYQEKISRAYLDLDQIFHSIGNGLCLIDPDFNIIRINTSFSKMFSTDTGDIKGKKCYEVISNERCGTPQCAIQEIRHGRERREHHFSVLSPDSEKRSFVETAVPLRDSEGRLFGIIVDIKEITGLIRAEERAKFSEKQLIQADKLASVGMMVSGVAHEINNPNNFITMNMGILRKAWDSAIPILDQYYSENGEFMLANIPYSEMREYIPQLFEGIRDGAERIKEITLNLKNYTRQDTPDDMSEEADINTAVRSAISLLGNQIRKSTNVFSVTYAENLPPVNGNLRRIEQVIVNLIQNACQSLSDTSQSIEIETFYEDGSVFVRIRDQGIGIPSEHMKRIFDPFFTTKQDSGGTGLGLYVCDGIVKAHGGKLTFGSEPGKGTTVLLRL